MNTKKSQTALTRRQITPVKTKRDFDNDSKKYPNGIKAFSHGLWQFWLEASGETKSRTTLIEFGKTSDFNNTAELLASRYKGSSIPKNCAHEMLRDLGGSDMELKYIHLRCIADYLDISVSTLLLFTQLVSIEKQQKEDTRKQKEELLKILCQMEEFCKAARSVVENNYVEPHEDSTEKPRYFVNHYQSADMEKETWLPDFDRFFEMINKIKTK